MSRKTKPADEPQDILAELETLTAKAAKSRLAPKEEARAIALLSKAVASDRPGLSAAMAATMTLPWNAGVTAVKASWETLGVTARRALISAMAKQGSEAGRRFCLSLARGLFPVDAAAAEKLITVTVTAMLADDGPTPKDRQSFASVLLGKTKPWISRAPVQEWKAARKIAMMTAEACSDSPPFAQAGVVRWLCESGLWAKLTTATRKTAAETGKASCVGTAAARFNKESRDGRKRRIRSSRFPAADRKGIHPAEKGTGTSPQAARKARRSPCQNPAVG
jgi:hypothetical protein